MSAEDPFETAQLRAAVLDAWQSSPTRFREDANAEEDLVLGGYRDRLVVELLQNAIDAAGPIPCRMRIEVREDALVVANDGQPLTREGVIALCSLRASAKRDDESAIGRFGVGFSAVLAITDAPVMLSTSGSVGFSMGRTRSLVGSIAGLGAELSRREGRVPVLRLPFTVDEQPPHGWTTEVRLPFRDAEAKQLAVELIDQLDPALPVVLEGFGTLEIVMPGRDPIRIERERVSDTDVVLDGTRWRVARRSGQLDPGVVDHRAVEDRSAHWWSLAAVPVDGDVPAALPRRVRAVLRAPQETHEEISVRIVLAASIPLDADRRRVRPGDVTDAVLTSLASTALDLLGALEPGRATLDLLPQGLPAGEVDAALRAQLEHLLPGAELLPRGARRVLDLGHATVPVAAVLAEVTTEFLPGHWPASHPAYDLLDVQRVDTRQLVDWLVESGVRPEAGWWDRLAHALLDVPDRDALAALPVPLADGTFAIGARGVLQPESGLDVSGLLGAGVQLRLLHPDARDAAWQRLGVELASPGVLLADDRLREAIADEEDALTQSDVEPSGELGEAVLGLVAGSGIGIVELPWLAATVLRSDGDGMWPASDLLMPGSSLIDLLADPVIVDPALVATYGRDALLAVGVADGFVVEGHDGATSIRDLDLVLPTAWPRALRLIAAAPDARHALLAGAAEEIATLAEIDGRGLDEYVSGSDPVLVALFDQLPVQLDEQVLRALGVATSLEELRTHQVLDALDRLGLEETEIDRGLLRAAYSQLARLVVGTDASPPLSVRAVVGGEVVIVPTKEAVVVDAPDLATLIGARPYVPAALSAVDDVARVLRVPLTSQLGPYPVASRGVPAEVSRVAYLHHEDLLVTDLDGLDRSVPWRLVGDQIHARDVDGVGRALALREGRWSERESYVARLRASGERSDSDFDE